MKSIICRFPANNGISVFYVILASISTVLCVPSCGLYGSSPCYFLPAPPGQTPSCARPGQTYCEHVDNYPTYLIKHLVRKWGYEAKKLIVDESREDFSASVWPDIPVFYDPAYIFPPKNHLQHNRNNNNNNNNLNNFNNFNNNHNNHFNNNNKAFAGYNYDTPGKHSDNNYILAKHTAATVIPTPPYLLYNSVAHNNQIGPCHDNLKVTPNNPSYWLKRIVRDISVTANKSDNELLKTPLDLNTTLAVQPVKSSRDVSINMDFYDITGVTRDSKITRLKRQSPGRSTLCQTSSQFITPQAALNNRGNWMFVVNEATTARQIVKAELCASNTCSNLCQLPNGYNSRCEQKFVQKRLIALQGNGQNLYTDVFWFPSCCVCTIAAN